jgi:hypothetical protein
LYSSDFFDYFYADSYGETFRSSFIVSVTSVSETFIKSYITAWSNVLNLDISDIKPQYGILEYLKDTVKNTFNIEIDFDKREVADFRVLLYIRNAMVHFGGNIYTFKHKKEIQHMTESFPSLHLTVDGALLTKERFCIDSMEISKRFFFYLFKLAIKKYPNYLN